MNQSKKNKELDDPDSNFFVATLKLEDYRPFDKRALKPLVLHNENHSMVLERLDKVYISTIEDAIAYIPPNPIALQLEIVERCLSKMKEMDIRKSISKSYYFDTDLESSNKRYENSLLIYEFISLVQQAIVFSYTAIETFVNLSIPESYEYIEKGKGQKKGVDQVYDKLAIERWIPLQRKLQNILTDIYSTKPIQNEPFWSRFTIFEKYRNEIIHQKSIEKTVLYRKYFDENIYSYVNVANEIISFFREEAKQLGKDNLLWPWTPEESVTEIPYIQDVFGVLKGARVTQKRIRTPRK